MSRGKHKEGWATGLRLARQRGYVAFGKGASEAACPYLRPDHRHEWLQGYRAARIKAGVKA
jgi:ribosome modulation factor